MNTRSITLALAGASMALGFTSAAKAESCPNIMAKMVDQTAISDAKLEGKTPRDVGTLTAAVLHQMGFHRGNDPVKYKNVDAHFVILPNGTIVQNHALSARLNASNGLNALGVAIEFAGNFQSVRKKWDYSNTTEENHPTTQQYESGRCLLFHLRAKAPKLTHVLAHRQSGPQRQNDPGPEVWCNVAEWALKFMHLQDGGPGFKVTGGREIDPKWRTWCSI